MPTAYTPEEGQQLIANLIFKQVDSNRGTDLELGSMTNTTGIGETTVYGDITEPTGGNYARYPLLDTGWTISSAGLVSYVKQVFTATVTPYSADITGFFICTTGVAPKLLRVQVEDAAANIAVNESYAVTPTIDIGTTS
jgi:hypothetical protein